MNHPANQIPVVPGLLTIISWVVDSVQVVVYSCKRSQIKIKTHKDPAKDHRRIKILIKDHGHWQEIKDSGEESQKYNVSDKMQQESTALPV